MGYVTETYQEAYSELITVTHPGISGSVVGQTWLNSQPGQLMQLGLYFSKKADAGDVRVVICDATPSGAPDPNRILCAPITLAPAALKVYPERTPVPIPGVTTEAGRRYGWALSSPGNHSLSQTVNNKFAQGSAFYSTDDGGWFEGDRTKDFAFDLGFAKFAAPRLEVALAPWQLSGGIGQIDVKAQTSRPPGTNIAFEYKIGAGAWIAGDGVPLAGLPALVQARAVLTGTTALMPGFGVGANSRVKTARRASTGRHISTEIILSAPAATVHVDVRLWNWRGVGHHTHSMKLRVGGTLGDLASYTTEVTPSATVDTIAPDVPDGSAIDRRYTFTLSPTRPRLLIDQSGTSDSKVATFYVPRRLYVALAA